VQNDKNKGCFAGFNLSRMKKVAFPIVSERYSMATDLGFLMKVIALVPSLYNHYRGAYIMDLFA